MKKVRIKTLSLTNFKGIKSQTINMVDVTRIYGDNATGKTTIVDAFTWLLFGKDSQDKKDFNIKTLDKNNNVIHKLDHEVTGVLEVDNREVTLRRCYKEKWVTRRGSADAELSGHETLFFWNDVPLQAGEYQDKINELLSENLFKLITSPLYFNNMKWQDRRNILVNISGNVDDATVASRRKEFQTLLNKIEGKSIEEYRKEIAMRKKKLRAELDTIPARIDEQERTKPPVSDWDKLQESIDTLFKAVEIIDAELEDESKKYQGIYTQKAEREKKIGNMKMELSGIEFKARQEFQNQMNQKQANIDKVKSDIKRIELDMQQSEANVLRSQAKVNELIKKIESLRAQWNQVNSTTLVIDESENFCPTCKQELPEDTIQEKRSTMVANFNENKAKKLADISAEGKALREQIDKIQSPSDDDYEALGKSLEDAHEWLKKAEQIKVTSVNDILGSSEKYAILSKEIAELESTPAVDVTLDNRDLKIKRSGLVDRINALKEQMSAKKQIVICEERIEELKRQESAFAQQLADLESDEFIISEFIRAKVDFLELRINAMFTGVQFKLFETQLNGGLVECCDTLVNGVPWIDANNAAKINSGIEIINVLSDHYGVTAPIFIDNSESITSINRTSAQRIELYVSEADKTLRIN